ncbi:MotA/TolQ/ExbB proton channel family protein [Magnetospira thiophila]
MSIGTILGVLFGFGLFVGAIAVSTNDPSVFIDLASFVMVVGLTFAATFISFEARYVILSLKLIYRIVFAPRIGRNILKSEVGRVIKWGYEVQKNGLGAVEKEIPKLKRSDKMLAYGVEMVISGYTGQEVREVMTNAIESTFIRNTVPADILKSMGGTAPACGMIGTLVGLIIMLGKMGEDPSALGPGLSVALITTLYGVLFARLIFIPAGIKVKQREEIVRFRNYLVTEGLVMLADRKSPRAIQDRMNSFLDPSLHFNIDKMKR